MFWTELHNAPMPDLPATLEAATIEAQQTPTWNDNAAR
jgi:hypothetical protein